MRKFLHKQIPSFLCQHVGRRHINRLICSRIQILLKMDQLLQPFLHCLCTAPCLVRQHIPIICIFQSQGLMIVSVVPDLSAASQKHISKILKPGNIFLLRNGSICHILIILDYRPGVPDSMTFCHIQHIRPPDIGIKIRNCSVVISGNIASVPHRYR